VTIKTIVVSHKEVGVAGPQGGTGDSAQRGHEHAVAWIRRWDDQQQAYMPDREDRFAALIDAVEAGAGRPDPLVLDLGCGPGSLAVRLLDRLPHASVIAVDADPVLLALGRAAWPGRSGLRFAELDMRDPGWSRGLGLDRQADAAVSTTALHWLTQPALTALYADLAAVLRPGGLLLDGDHLSEDEAVSPVLAVLGRALVERAARRRLPAGDAESWRGWWEAVAADPALADLLARRERLGLDSEHHGSAAGLLRTHVDALWAAGFTEVGTLWQRGENRLLCGVLGG
jgi:SAM-dependent methyltransferase